MRRFVAVVWTAAAIVLIGAGVVVGLGRLLLPFAPHLQPEIESWLSEELDRPVAVGSLTAEWAMTGPLIRLEDVAFPNPEGDRPRTELGRAEVALNMLAWVSPRIRFTEFRLANTHITLERTTDNRLRLLGFGDGTVGDPTAALEWFFDQGSISLVDSVVHVFDRRRDLILRFRDVNLTLDNQDQLHRIVGSARVPETESGRIEFRIALTGDVARHGIQDVQLYALGENVALNRWLQDSTVSGARVDQGRVDFEVWGSVTEGRARSVRGTLSMRDLMLESTSPVPGSNGVRLAPWFAATEIQGHFRWRARESGWRLDVDLDEWRGDGRGWPAAGLAVEREGDNWRFGAEYLHLEDLQHAVSVFDAAGTDLRRRLLALSPDGMVRRLRGSFDAAAEPARALRLEAELANVAWLRDGAWPGVEGINGRLRIRPDGASIDLDTRQLTVDFPRLFRRPVSLGDVSGRIGLRRAGSDWVLNAPRLLATAGEARVVSRLQLTFPEDGSRPFIDLRARIAGGRVTDSRAFMPVGIMHPDLVEWADRGLLGGRIDYARALVYGDLDHWPFDGGTGRFEVRSRMSEADVEYRRGWPAVTGADAELHFEGRGMQLTASGGRVFDAEVERVSVDIEDLERPWLEADIRAEGPATDLLRYLRESPLNEDFGPYIEGLSVTGAARVQKSLRLPLKDELGDQSVDGTVYLSGVDIVHEEWGLAFEDTRGRIRFDDEGFATRDMEAQFRGFPVALSLAVGGFDDSPEKGMAHLSGDLPPEALLEDYPVLAPLLAGLDGNATCRVSLALPEPDEDGLTKARLRLTSNLEGIAVNLPAPLNKPAEQSVPISVEWPVPYEGGIIDLRYGERLSARIEPGAAGGSRAGLHFGSDMPGLPDAAGALVTGHPTVLDLDGWLATFAGPTDDDVLALNRVDVEAGELVALQRRFADVALTVARDGDGWRAAIDSERAAGTVRVPDDPNAGLVGEFRRLYLPSAPEGVEAPVLDPRQLPPLHLLAEDFSLGDTQLGRVRLEAYPIRNGLRVDMVKAETPTYTLTGDGRWTVERDTRKQRSDFDLTITAENLGGMLSSFGYVGLVEKGQTIAHLDADWPGPPTSFALERLGGELEVTVGPGRILQVEPGAGRVFGLMSLQQLPRRLTLDFSDLFNAGLSFDAIQGLFQFREGEAHTDDLTLSGPSAFIQVKGRVDLVDRVYDQRVIVYPSVGNTLPLVGALAGGPTGAAAMFLLQGLFEKQISRMTAYRYQVTGPWNDPDIELLETREPEEIAGTPDSDDDGK